LLALTLLLHALDQVPDKIPGFTLHLDRFGLVRAIELKEVLDLPDVAQRTTQHLRRTDLLLLLLSLTLLLLALLLLALLLITLLLITLLLIALRHRDLLTVPLRRSSSIRVYPVRAELRHVEYFRGRPDKFICLAGGARHIGNDAY
jgi:hypothetical protein